MQQPLINQSLINSAFTYTEYKELTEKLLKEGKTTGLNQSEAYVQYTELNFQRVKRLDKTASISESLENTVKSVDEEQVWLILVEAWCGDVAQNVPVIHKIAELNQHIELKIILRDENPEIMDAYLTNGGKAIPKMIVLRKSDLKPLTSWGPRPAPVQKMVMDYKAMENKPPYSEFSVEVQRWYNKDKTVTLQKEIEELLSSVSSFQFPLAG